MHALEPVHVCNITYENNSKSSTSQTNTHTLTMCARQTPAGDIFFVRFAHVVCCRSNESNESNETEIRDYRDRMKSEQTNGDGCSRHICLHNIKSEEWVPGIDAEGNRI